MFSLVDEAIQQLDTALVWLETPRGSRRYQWHRQEEAALRQWWGRIPKAELAGRVSQVLQQVSGDSQAKRSADSCANRAFELRLPAYNGDPGEMALARAARGASVPYHIVIQAVEDGLLAAVRKGKQVYVSELDFALWLVEYRERLLMQGEMLNALDGTVMLSKREAMKLTGLCETHLTRYLQTGVIEAWVLPGIKTGRPGEWLVSREAAEAFVADRAAGRLRSLLDQNPVYVAMRNKLSADISALRREGRLEKRDPLVEPKSSYHPGCFTVKQVASHVGLSAQVIHEAIASGRVRAEVCVAGGRPRYAIAPEEARRYAGVVLEQTDNAGRRDTWYLRQIADAGLLTVRDLVRRWKKSEATVRLWTKDLPSRKWGRYRVFEPGVITLFEATNFLTLRDLAQRWGKSVATAGLWTRQAQLPKRKWGQCWVFETKVIEVFERSQLMFATATKPERIETPVTLELKALPAEREVAYQAALKLVARIDEDLTRGIRHYRTRAGELLTTLDEVVRAILGNDLLLPEESVAEVVWISSRDNGPYAG